jgi:hypothetical protein
MFIMLSKFKLKFSITTKTFLNYEVRRLSPFTGFENKNTNIKHCI